jgi:hypothetical protein
VRSTFTAPGAGGKTVYGGAVYVVYGGSGVTGSIDLARLPALIHVGSPSVSTPPGGGVAAVGDIDGDGLADFVVSIDGTIGCDGPGSPWTVDGPLIAGAWVVYGSATRLTGSHEIKDVAALLNEPAKCGLWNLPAGLGDIDGDGKADFAVSEQGGAAGDPYQVFVLYGRGQRLSGTVDLAATADAVISEPGATGGLGGAGAYRLGDVDSDGLADFVVRLPLDATRLGRSASTVRVVHSLATAVASTVPDGLTPDPDGGGSPVHEPSSGRKHFSSSRSVCSSSHSSRASPAGSDVRANRSGLFSEDRQRREELDRAQGEFVVSSMGSIKPRRKAMVVISAAFFAPSLLMILPRWVFTVR